MSLIENMSQALSIFTLADSVWNDERDAAAAQALLFKINDGCAKVRDAHSKLWDLLYPWSHEHLKHAAANPADPILELMAERERLVSETNATKASVIGEEAFDALVNVAGKRIAEIDEQIAI